MTEHKFSGRKTITFLVKLWRTNKVFTILHYFARLNDMIQWKLQCLCGKKWKIRECLLRDNIRIFVQDLNIFNFWRISYFLSNKRFVTLTNHQPQDWYAAKKESKKIRSIYSCFWKWAATSNIPSIFFAF